MKIGTVRYYDNKLEKHMIANIYDDSKSNLGFEDIDMLKFSIRDSLSNYRFGIDIDIRLHKKIRLGDITNMANISIYDRHKQKQIIVISVKQFTYCI